MYPKQRQELLLQLLAQHGFASYRQLAEHLGVSEITVRRDMKALQAQGLVEKSFGGGQVAKVSSELPYMHKRIMQIGEKSAIARAALQYIEPGMTIGIGAGTTTWMLAQAIVGFPALTLLTNSVNVAGELCRNGYDDILLTGGLYRTPSDALVGPVAERMVRQFRTDVLFLGTNGMHIDYGLSTPNLQEASINRALMERAAKVVVLADHTKWGIEAMCSFAHMDEVDVLITDRLPGDAERQALQDMDVNVVETPVPVASDSLS
ncbi:transcriptional regulator, DeoR family [Alicyclobacillus hesperidum URH17-3-68]|uniref:DNA-binding transcriptional regulator of sugar metabolism, DeoR/GlpR family n=1 Tax=Alicyclobacillus hesperidum TaxID=89784 RepID=A0A1H2QRZ7_9BACL|nr:DeoR/GlpR family DNA-binding transcription regulator [Alicyclobacillus hesperidum]EJY55543.1 transcriptional regulator, DeoR family [Alicyclobacillus hesperidum URH17-3-68]GLV13329.1 DeoR family transcriptional regulator [Alicyclobacillus hesperidum]SDW09650.1 DNA-binding transcriptional regulator of sugar metabolism, DeoR/GlpR family [Alicyclobacillus hesperidum]